MGDNYQFVLNGKEKEKKFAELFTQAVTSSYKEDRSEKWDIKIHTKIDVKGLKKIDRTDKDTTEDWHWVELKGNKGKGGWLYGNADYFAFETLNYWIIVEKKKLQIFLEIYVDQEKIIGEKIPYKLYQRKDRKDLITLIRTLDLCYIADAIIRKSDTFIEKKINVT